MIGVVVVVSHGSRSCKACCSGCTCTGGGVVPGKGFWRQNYQQFALQGRGVGERSFGPRYDNGDTLPNDAVYEVCGSEARSERVLRYSLVQLGICVHGWWKRAVCGGLHGTVVRCLRRSIQEIWRDLPGDEVRGHIGALIDLHLFSAS